MDQKKLQPVKEINQLIFYKYPYLDIIIATQPATAINDLWRIWTAVISDHETAASALQILIDQGRKAGIRIFLEVESLEVALPEGHRLTTALLSLDKVGEIFTTPKSGMHYSFQRLKELFQI